MAAAFAQRQGAVRPVDRYTPPRARLDWAGMSRFPSRLRAVSAATLIAFAAWLVGPGVPAASAAGATVAIVGVHGDGSQGEDELRALTEDLAAGFEAAGLTVRQGESLGALLRPDRDRILERVFLEPAVRSFEEGRILYEKAQPGSAIDALERAIAALEGNEEFLRDPRLRADVQLYLGLSHISLGAEGPAGDAFAEVVRADPERILDSLDYPPRIIEVFDEARADVLSDEPARLGVESGDRPARVFVDGRLVGAAPVKIEGLPPGPHGVLVDGNDAGRWFELVEVKPGSSRTLSPELRRAGLQRYGGDPLLPARSGAVRRLYEELAASSGSDLVVLAAFDDVGDLRVALYSARSKTFSRSVDASLAAAPGARSTYVKQMARKVAEQASEAGQISPEAVSSQAVPMKLGANPVLTDLLVGRAAAVAAVQKDVEDDVAPSTAKKPPPAGAIVAVIVASVLGAAGAGVGIYFGTLPEEDPPPVIPDATTGVLVLELP